MALLRTFERKTLAKPALHQEIDAKYAIFGTDDRSVIQIDTYGRKTREFPEKISQSFQLDKQGAEALFRILKAEFGFI